MGAESRAVETALFVFDGCDLLDVGGPYEVLLTANRLAQRRGDPAPFVVRTTGAGPNVTAYGGLGLVAGDQARHHADDPADELGRIDLLIVPGLIDLDAALEDDTIMSTLRQLCEASDMVASVCTGAFLLAAAGLLRGRPATTHHEDIPALEARDDVGEVVRGVRWVDDGDVMTAAGLSSGLALGLHLVDRFAGRALAVATARQIEHPWDPDGRDAIG